MAAVCVGNPEYHRKEGHCMGSWREEYASSSVVSLSKNKG